MTKDPGSMDVSQERRYEGLSPAHMGHAQSSLDLPGNVSVDWLWRGVARLPLGLVPAYNTSDVRLGWMATRRTEIAVVGRNLHDRRQQEWESSSVRIERGMHVEVTWRRRASVSHTRNVGPGRVRRVATGPPAAGDLDVGADPTGIALPPRRRGCPTSVCAEMRRRHGLWRPAPAPV